MLEKTLAELSIGIPVPRSISHRASVTFCPSAIYGGEEMAMTARTPSGDLHSGAGSPSGIPLSASSR